MFFFIFNIMMISCRFWYVFFFYAAMMSKLESILSIYGVNFISKCLNVGLLSRNVLA
jgi:hypothetical protein